MGELKVDGRVRTTEELHAENVAKQREIDDAARPRRHRRVTGSRRRADMDFRYPPEAEAFRKEFRAWLDANLPDELARRRPRRGSMEIGGERLERLRAWNRTLADARYAAIAWPEEWGGRGAGRHGAGRLRRGDAPRAARRAR